jgi:inosine/xanthosine triphosphatase
MKAVVVASTNPVKVRSTEAGFRTMFPKFELSFEPVAVPSRVSDQPMSDEETLRGAENRARAAELERPEADFWVGLEGGLDGDLAGGLFAFAWVVVRGEGRCGRSRTATFQLPEAVAELVRQGMELGEADDLVFGQTCSKQHKGAVGLLTANAIDRAQLYEPSVALALVPFCNTELFSSEVRLPSPGENSSKQLRQRAS